MNHIKKKIHHLLFPHVGNNHRSKILHHSSLVIALVGLTILTGLTQFVIRNAPDVLGISYSIAQDDLLRETNRMRAQNDLPPLKISTQLTSAASQKAEHMMQNDYWAHFAPDGTTPWSFIRGEGYDYVYAGENLAKGFTNSEAIVEAWMNSPTHRENLLSPRYNEIGFAILEGKLLGEDTVLVVELFGATERSIAIAQEEEFSPPTQNFAVENSQTEEVGDVRPVRTQDVEVLPGEIIQRTPALDITQITKITILIISSLMLFALLVDFVIVGKKNIPRIVGNNIDHILLLSIFIILVLVQHTGRIL